MEFEERLPVYLSACSMEVSPVRANVGPDVGVPDAVHIPSRPLPLQKHQNATETQECDVQWTPSSALR